MSAWLCSSQHIAALVSGMRQNGIVPMSHHARDKAFKTLTTENLRSLNYRYDDHGGTTAFHEMKTDAAYLSQSLKEADFQADSLSANSLLKQAQCYAYQACEHPEWKKSKAYGLYCDLVEKLAEQGASPDSEAYDAAPWGLD